MIYTSTEFIFFAAFALFFVVVAPKTLKILTLGIAGLFWYSIWSVPWLATLFGIFVFNALCLGLFENSKSRHRDGFFIVLICLNVLAFLFLKSASFWHDSLATPYGVSFFMMMLLGVVIDSWRNPESREGHKPQMLMTMLFFFPVLIGGPIERAKNLFPQFEKLHPRSADIADGILIFALGFAKRLLIAIPLTAAVNDLYALKNFNGLSLLGASAIATFQAYIDFSSYCDMGRGVARCFGVKVSFNFRPLYFAVNPNDYWQRWNISIGTWMRDYFTMPLLLKYGRKVPAWILLFFSFILIGLWHGVSLNWLIFGLFNGSMITLFARSQFWLRKSKKNLSVLGFFLVWITIVGNGIFQREDFRDILSQAFLSPSASNILIASPGWVSALASLAPFLICLLIFEYFQERTQDLDFYLRINSMTKKASAIILVGIFLTLLHFRLIGEQNYDLPLYFRF